MIGEPWINRKCFWGMALYLSSIFILLFARGNLECESVHSFNGSALGLVLYAFGDF